MDIPIVHVWMLLQLRKLALKNECPHRMFTLHRDGTMFELLPNASGKGFYEELLYAADILDLKGRDWARAHLAFRVVPPPKDLLLVLSPYRDMMKDTQSWVKSVIGLTVEPHTYMLEIKKEPR